MVKIKVSPLVYHSLEQLATCGRFKPGGALLLPDGRWEVEVSEDVMEQLNKLHADPDRAIRIKLGLPGGRDN